MAGPYCETGYGDEHQAQWLLDCDDCKNVFVCSEHLVPALQQHLSQCQKTVHVDAILDLSKEDIRASSDQP
jgi:hypothetical protein